MQLGTWYMGLAYKGVFGGRADFHTKKGRLNDFEKTNFFSDSSELIN